MANECPTESRNSGGHDTNDSGSDDPRKQGAKSYTLFEIIAVTVILVLILGCIGVLCYCRKTSDKKQWEQATGEENGLDKKSFVKRASSTTVKKSLKEPNSWKSMSSSEDGSRWGNKYSMN